MSTLEIEFDPDAREATATLKLGGRAGYREAPQLRRALFDAIAASAGRNLVVELALVEKMDTAAMAVLVEGCIATRGGETPIFLMCPSSSVRKVFELAGLEEALTRCYTSWEDIATAAVA
ncbi:MAG: STAS domain-containing protein [bacterium]|nr:STAS domain-containing protein [bacterium]